MTTIASPIHVAHKQESKLNSSILVTVGVLLLKRVQQESQLNSSAFGHCVGIVEEIA